MIIVSYDMTILLYVYILFTISIIVDFLYISYIVIYIHISVSSNLKRIFFIIVEYRISCIQFFKKKFNCFFRRIDAVYVYIFYIRMIYVQMSPQIFCRDNNWFYVCASTSMQHYIYKIYETFSLFFRFVCCSPVK